MASSQSAAPSRMLMRSRDVVSRTSFPSRGRRSRSSSSDDNDQYAALCPYPGRRRRSRSRIQSPIIIYDVAHHSRLPRPDFQQGILSACRRGAIHMLDKLFYDASLVPARPDELPTTDEMVLEALDAPSTGMLSAVIRRDRAYKWSDLAIIKAIEKDKAYDPPLYLDAFLYLGLSPHTVWDRDNEHHDALMWAVRSGSAEFVAMLLSAGADPNGAKVCKRSPHIQIWVRRANFGLGSSSERSSHILPSRLGFGRSPADHNLLLSIILSSMAQSQLELVPSNGRWACLRLRRSKRAECPGKLIRSHKCSLNKVMPMSMKFQSRTRNILCFATL